MKESFRKVRAFNIPDGFLKHESERLAVWWYGPIIKNFRAQSVPKAVVFFRRFDKDGKFGQIVRRETSLTHLGLLRIGSVWKNGVSDSRVDLPTETFDVSFDSDGWRIISPYEVVHREGRSNPITSSDYLLNFSPDKNFLLDFKLSHGRNLLIPCMEYFIRCYGRSAEVKRVLATYHWEDARKRLFKQVDESQPGTWPIKLAKRLYNDDVIFLAHVFYEQYAQRLAKSIYAQIESTFSENNPYVFFKVAPWYRGKAQICVAGLPINEGQTFLGLRILGCSQPQGDTILRDKEDTNKVGETRPEGDNGADESSFSVRRLEKLPDIIDLTDDNEPDHGAASLEIEEDVFKVLGEPRAIIDVRRARLRGAVTSFVHDGASSFSTGEPYGSGKGVAHASIHARAVMETQGVLRDMWNAAVYLRRMHPESIQSVEWFTFEDGFRSAPLPRLIALEAFPTEVEELGTGIRKWVFYDPVMLIPRGALIIKLVVFCRPVFLFEIQRRPVTKKDENGAAKEAEESFKGLVFTLQDDKNLVEWLRRLLNQVRYAKGVVQKLTREGPGETHAFKHAPANNENVPCEAAVKNALRKVGIEL